MTYRSYVAEFRSGSAEIGTAVSNIDGTGVIVITMYRPSYLALSTKDQIDNLYNFLYLDEDQEKTRIVLKNVDGRLFSQFIHSTNTNKDLRVQITLELLKKLLRYDVFPNSIKFKLIADDQILLNENGVYLRELVNFTDDTPVSDKEIVSSLGYTISRLLPSLEGAESTLVEQMKHGNNNFNSIADVYGAFRDVFIYQVPAQLEKRIYIYRNDEDAIDSFAVDEFLRQEEYRRIEREKIREGMRLETRINDFEQKIANQTEYSSTLMPSAFESKEISLEPHSTKQVVSDVEDFEIVRTAQPKTIDLNEVSRDITNSLQEIVDEFTIYNSRVKAVSEEPKDQTVRPEESTDQASRPEGVNDDKPSNSSTEDSEGDSDLILTDDFDSGTASKESNNKKKNKKSRKKKKNKRPVVTDHFGSFIDEAISTAEEVAEAENRNDQIFRPASEPKREIRDDFSFDDDLYGATVSLDYKDREQYSKVREYSTTKLDDESASDLDRFYREMDNLKKRRNSSKVVTYILTGVFCAVLFVVALLFFRDMRQPVVPEFSISNSTLSTIQCVNSSKGQKKIVEYKWEIFLVDPLASSKEPLLVNTDFNPSFTFKTPGEYLVRLTVKDKDGKEYTPVEKTVTLNFEVTN